MPRLLTAHVARARWLWHRSSMNPTVPLAAALLVLLGDEGPRDVRNDSFDIFLRGLAASCSIEVGGRKVTTDELVEIARPAATSGRPVRIKGDSLNMPWRCVAGAIYALQMAGFKNVDFTSVIPEDSRS